VANPSELLQATSDRVDVWFVPLQSPQQNYEQLLQALSGDERKRAARFYFDVHRKRFVIGRAMLRTILSRYLGIAPAEIRFDYGAHGKPILAGADLARSLSFNASGSNDLAVYGVTRDREIGIDVEWMEPDRSCDRIVERFYAEGEKQAYREVGAAERRTAFFQSWTRKEAYIKAIGDGLSRPLNSFELSLAPGTPPCVIRDDRDPDAASRWTMRDLQPGQPYAGALVISGSNWELQERHWGDE